MKEKLILFFLLITGLSIAQNKKEISTEYLRYNRSLGTERRSNYKIIKTKLAKRIYACKEYYKFSQPMILRAEYTLIDGKKEGDFKRYGKDKLIKKEGKYKNDQKIGEWKFYKEGTLHNTVTYIDGEKEGIATYYHNNKKLYTWTYRNGKSEGSNKKYYKDSILKFEGTYKNGKLEGKSIEYYKKGTLKFVTNYKEGKLHGPYIKYWENEKIMAQGTYANGKEIGEWKWYRDDGTLASHELYKQNGKIEKLTFYDNQEKALHSRKKDLIKGVISDKERLQKTIQQHIKDGFNYPISMSQQGIEGKVYLRIKVDKKGNVNVIKCHSDTHPALEIKAKQLISSLPKQKPAIMHNIPMSVLYSIPIVFHIRD